MDPYLGPGALVPSLSADQCAAALAQSGMNPPPPAQHVQPKALPVASLPMRPARTLAQAAVTHTRGTKFASFFCRQAKTPTGQVGTGTRLGAGLASWFVVLVTFGQMLRRGPSMLR